MLVGESKRKTVVGHSGSRIDAKTQSHRKLQKKLTMFGSEVKKNPRMLRINSSENRSAHEDVGVGASEVRDAPYKPDRIWGDGDWEDENGNENAPADARKSRRHHHDHPITGITSLRPTPTESRGRGHGRPGRGPNELAPPATSYSNDCLRQRRCRQTFALDDALSSMFQNFGCGRLSWIEARGLLFLEAGNPPDRRSVTNRGMECQLRVDRRRPERLRTRRRRAGRHPSSDRS